MHALGSASAICLLLIHRCPAHVSGLSGEIKITSDWLSAKCIVVENVISLVNGIAETVILLKINAKFNISNRKGSCLDKSLHFIVIAFHGHATARKSCKSVRRSAKAWSSCIVWLISW